MTTNDLLDHLDKLHTTDLGVKRVRKNLSLTVPDIIAWCRQIIQDPTARLTRRGKNWYVEIANYRLTINAHSYTLITAHKITDDR